jgi:transglutaminase-like putative cysteine protease
MAAVVVPHALRLPVWMSVFVVAVGVWCFGMTRRGWRVPGKWALLGLAMLGAAGVMLSFRTLVGRDAGTAMLVLLLGLKLLEARSRRDQLVVVCLCYFLVAAYFLHSQTLFAAAYLLGAVLVVTVTLLSIHSPSAARRPLPSLRFAGALLLQAIPLMLVLFVLFPRVPGPLWGLPRDAHAGLTGLSDEMAPGSINKLAQSDAVAFRVHFNGRKPEQRELYWRGPVLWYTDGQRWKVGFERLPVREVSFQGQGEPVEYAVTLEPHNKRWLFALDLPARIPKDALMQSDFQLLSRRPVVQRIRYEAASYTQYRAEGLSDLERRLALQLPQAGNARSRDLAAKWRAEDGDGGTLVARALGHFREQKFFYTLEPPLLDRDPIDGFLFETRRGFCEHYAGAFVFLMRAAGVPARVVTGYHGGDANPLSDYMIVRQQDAHAWAEVWLEGRGWVRVDPTAAVSPARVEAGAAAALPGRDPLLGFVEADNLLAKQLRYGWDMLNNHWNQWVLGYNQERQLDVLSRFGLISWQDMAIWLMGASGALLGGLMVILLWPAPLSRDPAKRAYEKFCRKLARAGVRRGASEGPELFARRAVSLRPEWSRAIGEITALYIAARYGKSPAASVLEELRRQVRGFPS